MVNCCLGIASPYKVRDGKFKKFWYHKEKEKSGGFADEEFFTSFIKQVSWYAMEEDPQNRKNELGIYRKCSF